MKIERAEIFGPNFGADPKQILTHWHPIILKLTTDDGLVGIGEAGLAYGSGRNAGIGMVQDLVEAFVIGANPLDREVIWNAIHRSSFWAGACGPVVNGAMSAIDIALWDITGKALGQPIWQLLGGKVNADLRTYASQITMGWGKTAMTPSVTLDDYVAGAVCAVEEGYDAIKFDPLMLDDDGKPDHPDRLKGALSKDIVNRGVKRMRAVRDAVGPDIDIILELHSYTSLTGAQRFVQACEDLDLFMVEEAVNYNNARPARSLKQRMPHIRMAGGERIFTRWQFQEYLEDGSFDMIQPDICLAGGISESKKICDMAHAYEVTVQSHICGSPISTAAALHIETSIPNFEIHEHHVIATSEMNRLMCVQDLQPVKGRFTVSDAPGLGLDLNEDYLRSNGTVIEIR